MLDPRVNQLASLLVNYSCHVQPGENVLIEGIDVPNEVLASMIRAVYAAGGRPFVTSKSKVVQRALYQCGTEEMMALTGSLEADRMNRMQAYIAIRGASNSAEYSDVKADKMKLYREHWWTKTHSEIRIKKTKWVVTRWPSPSMAQDAGMSTEAFEDFYFRVSTFDYSIMAKAIAPLAELMNRTDRVRIIGPGTDLQFSIKGIGCIPCVGASNIPDGECFTAPVRDSVEGVIAFNTPSNYEGKTFENVVLNFRRGNVIEASASGGQSRALNEILDMDEGARYIGEFSLGFNPFVLNAMNDILFDEKIAGSFHFTPGQAYDEADNGNRSMVHWDMVMLQRAEQGGGEIYFDDVLIRKDGLFVVRDLEPLNPDRLGQPG